MIFFTFLRKNIISLGLLVLLCACADKSAVTHIHLAHGLNEQHPVHLGIVRFAELVKERTKGEVEINIFPNGQLGNERECLELIQIGSLGITKVASSTLENFSQGFKIFTIPYLFRSATHKAHVLQGDIGIGLLNQLNQAKMQGLCYFDAGSRSFYTKFGAVTSSSNIKGKKIRVMKSQNAIQMIEKFGGIASPISYGELYTALQQGVVDGAENNLPSFVTSKHYEVCKYYSFSEHASFPDVLVIGQEVWETLTDAQQAIVQQAALEASVYQSELWKKAESECIEILKKEGVQLNYPDKTSFMADVQSMKEQLPTELKTLVKKVAEVE